MPINEMKTSTCETHSSLVAGLVLLAVTTFGPLAHAESQQDLLVFASLSGVDIFSASDPALEETDKRATASFLYTYNNDRFRFVGEYIWSNTESELERLQAAWKFDEQTMLWAGRFHSVSNFWTTEYHHGQFMQTSISRPGLEEWEDESGPMPSHVTGLWLQHKYATGSESAIDLSLAAGLAPRFEGQQLMPFDVLNPEPGHELSVAGRIAYRPDVLSNSQIGVAIAHHDIAVSSESNPALADLNTITQSTFGVFGSWHWEKWVLLGNFVYFDIDLDYVDGGVKDKFLLGYVQAEYAASEDWTVFGRTEFGDGEDNSPYLQLLPAVIAHKQMLGIRWDIADAHALTMEIANTSTQGDDFSHDHFKEIRLQWSAVFP